MCLGFYRIKKQMNDWKFIRVNKMIKKIKLRNLLLTEYNLIENIEVSNYLMIKKIPKNFVFKNMKFIYCKIITIK